MTLFPIPCSTGPVEAAFSHAGDATSGKKSRTKPALLNDKLFVHLNKRLVIEKLNKN